MPPFYKPGQSQERAQSGGDREPREASRWPGSSSTRGSARVPSPLREAGGVQPGDGLKPPARRAHLLRQEEASVLARDWILSPRSSHLLRPARYPDVAPLAKACSMA